MLDINFLRQNPEAVKKAVQDKQSNLDIDEILRFDEEKRNLLHQIENLRRERKQSKDRSWLIKSKALLKGLEGKLEKTTEKLTYLLYQLPNPALPDVPVGKNETENIILKTEGKKPQFSFKPKDHIEIGEKLGIIDVKKAAEVSGARFNYLIGKGALLELALVNYIVKFLTQEGFVAVVPPVMIKESPMRAMGYLEKGGREEIYYLPKDELYLAGTSEQALGPVHQNDLLEEGDLPLRYFAFSTCFRREAGSYGKDTKGIIRVHQFDKIEMFSFVTPENSDKEHQYLLELTERIVRSLGLSYQIVKMCTGDLGNPAARKYDVECYLPSQNRYLETHSISNCTDFQARRLNVRFKDKDNKVKLVHTLNATAAAMGRMIVVLLENFQQKDGSVVVPEALFPYLDFKKI